EMLVKRIADLVNDKKIVGISGLRDESSRRAGIRIVIDIKRNAMGNIVLNQLYAHTSMETVFGSTMLVVDHNRPRIMNLAQVLQAYIDHRLEVVTRRAKFDLEKAEARAHILEGLLIALDNIDEVVKIIRGSQTRDEAAVLLGERFNLTRAQTGAILDMRLHQLTGLAAEDLQAEYDQLQQTIAYLRQLLASREMRLGVIRDELLEMRAKYNDERRSEIIADDGDLKIGDLIARHSCVITVSNTGYIKRVPAATYRTQHRGGKGIMGMETKEEDYVEHLFNADSHDLIFFFTDRGFMHWLNVYEIPEGSRTSKGKAIVNMIKIEPGEKIKAMLTLKEEDLEHDDRYLVMASRNGYIKKTALTAFKNLRRAGLRALTIEDDDDLIGAAVSAAGDQIILSTAHGMACRFDEGEIRPMGRTARGVTGIRFKFDGDYVVGMEIVSGMSEGGAIAATTNEPGDDTAEETIDDTAEETIDDTAEETIDETESVPDHDDADIGVDDGGGPEILVVTNGGMGKRSYVATYRLTRRGAKGVTSIRLNDGENVVAAIQIIPGDELILTTENGLLVRIPVDEIRVVGRASKGVKIMNFKGEDRITGVAKVVKVDGEDDTTADNETVNEAATAADGDGTEDAEAEVVADKVPTGEVAADDETTGDTTERD
ncbi:MAG: DNA gyrase C-terminal beta-propeller domain-containing protein, partial [Victivallales bacterium]|nr:DNA gyrase C-terminal beta-propeller domain-containing protein [Victivallales bacterium]